METLGVIIQCFEALDGIAQEHDVPAGLWAEKSGLKYQSRLSEFRAIAEAVRNGNKKRLKKIGRAITYKKCKMLLRGLVLILGDRTVSKQLLECVERSTDPDKRLLLLIMELKEGDEKRLVEEYAKMVIRGRPSED